MTAAQIALAALTQLHGVGTIRGNDPVYPSVRSGDSLQGSSGWFSTALDEAEIEGYT
ncbi:hypothetical protein [Acidobacterium sp. S8]|uniref:hypothetical protein n=1 Tax=Acidobacterium sp. S8 TaxID=1641854 RepID=UPI00131AFF7A|nr:hypothetical protein [Acidobacterium sp. S8]